MSDRESSPDHVRVAPEHCRLVRAAAFHSAHISGDMARSRLDSMTDIEPFHAVEDEDDVLP